VQESIIVILSKFLLFFFKTIGQSPDCCPILYVTTENHDGRRRSKKV